MADLPQTSFTESTLPPDVSQGAVAAKLGDKPLADYWIAPLGKQVVAGIIMAVIGLGLIIWSIYVAVNSTPSDRVSSNWAGGEIFMNGVGLVLAGFAISNLVWAQIHKDWCVYLYEHGFLHKKGNAAAQAFRWDEIDTVWYQATQVKNKTTYIFRVRRRDGYQITLNNFTNIRTLGNAVCDRVTEAQIPRMTAAYHAGQTLTFGPLYLNKQGVGDTRLFLPWPKVDRVLIMAGDVRVRGQGRLLEWPKQRVATIPNVFAFIALVKIIVEGRV